jgi:hypothetical protein
LIDIEGRVRILRIGRRKPSNRSATAFSHRPFVPVNRPLKLKFPSRN